MYQKKSRIKSKGISDLQPCQGHFHQYQRVAMLTVVIIDHHLKKFWAWGEKSRAYLACELSTQIGREPTGRSFQSVQPHIEGQIWWKTCLFEKNRTKIVSHVHSQLDKIPKTLKHFQLRQSRQCCEAWTYACHLSSRSSLCLRSSSKKIKVALTLGLRHRRVSRWKNQLLRRPSSESFVLASAFIMKHWQDVFMKKWSEGMNGLIWFVSTSVTRIRLVI